MRARAASSDSRSVFFDAPAGYPIGRHPVDGPWEVPILARLSLEHVPCQLVAFNDRGRAKQPRTSGIHFFRDDSAFQPVLQSPLAYVSTFSDYGATLTPDVTLGAGMNAWMKAQRVAYARMVGVVWELRGLRVIPTVRWTSTEDLDMVCSGIATQSVIAVSNYGSRRDPTLRNVFERNLPAVVERLSPVALMVFGSARSRVFASVRKNAQIFEYRPPTATTSRGMLAGRRSAWTPLF